MTDGGAAWSPGTKLLGEFVVERALGAGGFGTVYCVRGGPTSERFAVKTILPTRFRSEEARGQFLRELQLWLDLPAHPHLVACRFFRTIGDRLAIFAEFVAGGSLADRLRMKEIAGPAAALDVLIQVAWGLDALHHLGLIHQDVKPANVLLTTDGLAKVSDFGLARAAAAAVVDAGRAAMTLLYRSPEQAAERPLTAKTDMWSWAVSAVELFAGTQGAGEAAGEVLDDVAAAMPVDLVAVLRRCFREDPAERWQDMGEVAHRLTAVYRQATGRPYERLPPLPPELERWRGPHDRSTGGGARWAPPRTWLMRALQAAGRDPAEALAVLPVPARTRAAQAVADLRPYEQAFRILERLRGAGQPELAADVARLCLDKALVHAAAGDHPGALRQHDHAIRALRPLIDGQATSPVVAELLARACLAKGNCCAELGDGKAAVTLYDRVVQIHERLFGVQERQADADLPAMALMNQANALARMGRPGDALPIYTRASGVYERLLGEAGRLELVAALARLHLNRGNALADLGQGPEAVAAFERAIVLYQPGNPAVVSRILGAKLAATFAAQAEAPVARWFDVETGELAVALVSQAAVLLGLGEPRRAAAGSGRAVTLLERLVEAQGRDDLGSELARAYTVHASAQAALGHAEAVRGLHDRAVEILETLVTRMGRTDLSAELAAAHANRAEAALAAGDATLALRDTERALAIYDHLVGAGGRRDLAERLGAACNCRAVVLRAAGDVHGALALYDRALALYRALDGPPHERLATALLNKANALLQTGKNAEALGLYDEGVAICEKLASASDRPDAAARLAAAYLNQSAALTARGDHTSALARIELAVALYARLRDGEKRQEPSPELARARTMRAMSLAALGRQAEAAAAGRDARSPRFRCSDATCGFDALVVGAPPGADAMRCPHCGDTAVLVDPARPVFRCAQCRHVFRSSDSVRPFEDCPRCGGRAPRAAHVE